MMKARAWIKWVLLLYATVGIALYYGQSALLFHPEKLDRQYNYQFRMPFRELNIPMTAETNLNLIQFKADSSRGPVKGVILYFHGNRNNISWYAPFSKIFTKQGYEVWMPDYPGFGKSTGELKEETFYQLAEQVYKLARTRFAKDSIIIYGKSLGTAVATSLAAKHSGKALVLETPYYSMHSLLRRYFFLYPVSRMIRYKFPINEFLPWVTAPIIIFQGTDDWVIPYSNAKKLVPLLKPADRFISIENGQHNDLPAKPEYQQVIDSLLTH